jgi:hypothetical protein
VDVPLVEPLPPPVVGATVVVGAGAGVAALEVVVLGVELTLTGA